MFPFSVHVNFTRYNCSLLIIHLGLDYTLHTKDGALFYQMSIKQCCEILIYNLDGCLACIVQSHSTCVELTPRQDITELRMCFNVTGYWLIDSGKVKW